MTDATAAIRSGLYLPLGGAGLLHGGHKGYGLGLVVDILCGLLAAETSARAWWPGKTTTG